VIPVGHVKINLSLDATVAAAMRRLASEDGKPISQYLARLIQADEQRRKDRLAEEGYRWMAGESAAFARDSEPLVAETWPEWGRE
jgi:hypothetical protein